MGIEIERKFLVKRESLPSLPGGIFISQGYIETKSGTTVRIRIKGDSAFLTLKGKSKGASRSEFEYEIPVVDAQEQLAEYCANIITKKRFEISVAGNIWELDIFEGKNRGLYLAEVELQSEDESFDIPAWASKEVTDDPRYYNAYLAQHPFSEW